LSSTILKKGFTCSAFDLLHAGHIAMLEEAKSQCDHLIVGLQTDPTIDRPEKNKPVQTIIERYIQLKGCKYVDEIIPYQTEADLMDLIKVLNFDVRIIGEDYLEKDFTGKQYCLDNSIPIYYNSRQHTFSTSDLRQRIQDS
jgi:glycerol-3-phosphate cytidylyltransferase